MKLWSATEAISNYRPSGPHHTSPDMFAARTRACAVCPERHGNFCTAHRKLVNVAARPATAVCPRWGDFEEARAELLPAVERLAVVTSYFNPCRYRRLRENHLRFRAGMLGADVWTVELALDDDPWLLLENERVIQVRGTRARHALWQKERLLNLAIEHLPADVDAVAWIDADLIFLEEMWQQQLREALRRWPVVQLFSHVHDTDADGRIIRSAPGYGYVTANKRKDVYGRPGGGWAARREVVAGGLYDVNVLGGGDSELLAAWRGQRTSNTTQGIPGLTRHWEAWAGPQYELVQNRIGHLHGDVVHLFHGEHANRRYVERYQILRAAQFDPALDVETDAAGLLRWTEHALTRKPGMVEAVRNYFAARREDD